MKRLAITIFSLAVLSACSSEKSASEYLDSAIEYKAAGRIPAALIESRNSARLDPENPAVRALIGELELLTGDPENSEKELLRALELGFPDKQIARILSRAYLLLSKYDQLLALETKSLSAEDAAEVLANQAHAYLYRNEFDLATDTAAKSLQAYPMSPAGLTINARLHATDNNLPAARKFISQALESKQSHSDAWELLGDINVEEKLLDEAVIAYTKAAETAANNLPAILKRTQTNLELKQYELVQDDLAQLKKSGLKLPIINLIKTEILFNERKFLDAQTELEVALRTNPDYQPAIRSLALTHLMLGNLGQADQFGKRYQNATDSADSRVLLAAIRLQQDLPDQAEDILQPLLITGSLDTLGARMLATTYLKQNNIDKAVTTMLGLHARLAQAGVIEMPHLAMLETPSTALTKELLEVPTDQVAIEDQDFLTTEQQLLVSTVEHLAEKRTEEAMLAVRKLATATPDNAALTGLTGRIHLANDDLDAARSSFEQAVNKSRTPESSTIMLALLDLNAGNTDAARTTLSDALENSSSSSREQLLLALAGLEESVGDFSAMLKWLNQATDESPGAYLPSIALANHYTRLSEHAKIVETLNSLADDSYRTPRTVGLLAQAHIALNQSDPAIELLEPMVNQQPDSATWRYLRARAYAIGGNAAKAINDLNAALRLDPSHVPSLLAKANLNIETDQLQSAAEQLSLLQELVPESPALDVLANRLTEQTGRKAPTNDSTAQQNTTTIISEARTLWAEGRRDEALSTMTDWLHEHPDDVTVTLTLGNTYGSMERINDAIEMFETALVHAPDNFVALNNLAWHLREIDPQTAAKHAEASLEQQPDSVETLDTLAVIRFNQGNLAEAERAFRKIQSLGATDPTILFHGARIEAAIGNKAAAKEILQPLVIGSMDFPEADKALNLYNEL